MDKLKQTVLNLAPSGLKPETIQDLVEHGYDISQLSKSTEQCPVMKDWRKCATTCIACYSEDVNHVSPMLRKATLPQSMCIDLPLAAKYFTLDSIKAIHTDSIVDISSVTQQNNWLIIDWALLDRTVGKKLYAMSFNHDLVPMEGGELVLYFGYNILDDNPDKPYIYMNKEE